MTRPGNYQSGFAPRDFAPRYPQLWQGCVGAWHPGLGPSGLTLRDWSGFQRHGTLTNATLSTVWAIDQGDYSLNLDGASDHVNCGASSAFGFGAAGYFTVAAWVKTSATAIQVAVGTGGAAQYWLGMFNGTAGFFVMGGSASFSSPAMNDGKWHLLAGVKNGGTVSVWLDGIQRASTSDSSDNSSGNPLAIGGFGGATFPWQGSIKEARVYQRALSSNEMMLLALRPGIAYEPLQPRRYRASTGNRRRRVLIAGAA